MEDLNMLAADCIVISCCCECLVLQIVIFVLMKLPCKMIRKTKAYARKRLKCRKKRASSERYSCGDDPSPLRVEVEEFLKDIGVHGFGDEDDDYNDQFCSMDEAEKVLEGLSEKGRFGFGSFWGREEASTCTPSPAASSMELDLQLSLDLVASFRY